MSEINELGGPPDTLSHAYEVPIVAIESEPGSGNFTAAPFEGDEFTVEYGINDHLPTATIQLNLARNPSFDSTDPQLKDWQVTRLPVKDSIFNVALTGRRIQVRTSRGSAQDDWPLFEGFIDRLVIGGSGNSDRMRHATIYATSTAVAADRELSCFLIGQWRRSRSAELEMAKAEEERDPAIANQCVLVTGAPLVFNPGGRGNCDPRPLEFEDGSVVYIPTDPDNPNAERYTVARMLRYIQWAGFQGAVPEKYDEVFQSSQLGVNDLADADNWTPFRLRHYNMTALVGPVLREGALGGEGGGVYRNALLRAIPDVAVNMMSVLEALVYVCDRSAMSVSVFHDMSGARVVTYLVYSIRGWRVNANPNQDPGDMGGLHPGAGGGGPQQGNEASGGTTRGVYLYIPSDKTTSSGETIPQLFARSNVENLSLMFDEAGLRTGVAAVGSCSRYEMTADLLPGWEPNADWEFGSGTTAQLANVNSPDWISKYHNDPVLGSAFANYYRVGRYWVLNEDGAFLPSDYVRTFAPWDTAADWQPYRFRTAGGLADLLLRGDNGFSCRRRRFLPPRAQVAADTDAPVGIQVLISVNGGTSYHVAHGLNVEILPTRCGIYFSDVDLSQIRFQGETDDFVRAYIKGKLRIRVFADVEGDDACRAMAPPEYGATTHKLRWFEMLDRAKQFNRLLRSRSTNDFYAHFASPADDDDTAEADAAAVRHRRELELRRCAGTVTIPWLVRWHPGKSFPWQQYGVADEVLGIQTQLAGTFVDMLGSRTIQRPAPRIIGIQYSYRTAAQPEMTTKLTIEDRIYEPADRITDPKPDQIP